jgi:hypothetical protein
LFLLIVRVEGVNHQGQSHLFPICSLVKSDLTKLKRSNHKKHSSVKRKAYHFNETGKQTNIMGKPKKELKVEEIVLNK